MKITYIKLVNFASIFAGMGKKKIEIDFTCGVNPIFLIVGKNGSGKTSLLSNLHPFPYVESVDVRNTQDLILPGVQGRKTLHIENGSDKYVIDIYYDVDRSNKRTTKCFIWKNSVSLNKTGLVRSYYDVLKMEFGIEPSFLRILRLGPNVSDLVSMKASERKDYISTFLQDIDIYTKLYQTIKSESTYTKNQLKVVTTNYDNISSETELKSMEASLSHQMSAIDTQLVELHDKMSKCQYRLDHETLSDGEIEGVKSNYAKARLEVLDDYEKIGPTKWNDYGSIPEAYTKISMAKQRLDNDISQRKSELNIISDQLVRLSNKIADYNNKLSLIASQDSLENIDTSILEYQSKMKDLVRPNQLVSDTATYSMINILWNDVVTTIHDNMDVNVLAVLKREVKYMSDGELDVLDCLSDVMDRKLSSLSEQIATIKSKDQTSILKGKVLFVPTECTSSNKCPYFKILDGLKVKTQEQSIDYLEAAFDVYMMAKNHLVAYKSMRKTIDQINSLATEMQVSFVELFLSILNFNSDIIAGHTQKIHDLVAASTDNDLYQTYADKIADLTRQRETISGFDSVSFIKDELKTLEDELRDLNTKYDVLVDKIDSMELTRADVHDDYAAIEYDYNVYMKYTTNQAYYVGLKAEYEKARQMKLIRTDMTNQIISIKESISKLESVRGDLDVQLKDIYYRLKSKQDLAKQMEIIQKRFETVELIREALSSTKGIPLIFIQLYLKNIQILANSILHDMFGDNISLLDFNITDKEFSIPYIVNGIEIADASYSSQGERAVIVVALSFALLQQFMGKYNVLLLDEVDSALYKDNRRKFIKLMETQMERIGCEQAFMITHNELFENYPVNIIETSPMEGEFKNSCIIWPPPKVEYEPNSSWQKDYI